MPPLLALGQSKALGWQVRGDTGDAGDFQIDNVRLLPKSALAEKAPNLEVRNPEPPTAANLESLRITHPLQPLAIKSLDRGYNITNWLEQGRFQNYDTYNDAFIKKLAAAGFKGLRLPIDLDLYVESQAQKDGKVTVVVHPDLFKVLDDFNRWTKDQGLSLTIDYHQYDKSLDFDVPYPYSRERWSLHQEDLGFSEFNAPWQPDQLHDYYRNGNRVAMKNRLIQAKSWAVKHQVPIICDEFGAHEATSRKEDVARYYTDLVGVFRELEIPWQIWFMIMDAKTGEIERAYKSAVQL